MTTLVGASGRTALEGLRAWTEHDGDRIAITDGESSLTFAETLVRVEATAAVARAALAQAAPGAYLPVLVDRTTQSAIAVLACLAGRVPFFPVDAKASPELQRNLMRRAGDPGFYLVGAASAASIGGAEPIHATDDAQGVDAAIADGESEDPAVVIFSSGSTGDPKGIVLPHRAMQQRWRSRDLLNIPLGEDLREPLIAPLDSAWGLNLLSDVASGFTVHVVDVNGIGLPAFLSAMAELRPTAMAIPAQLGRILGNLPERSVVPLPSLRRVNIGSEGFRYEYVRKLSRILGPDTTIVHNLASSEAGREIVNRFALKDASAEGVVHLGQIVFPDDTRLVPVDGHDDDVAEVHMSGAIASGYLDDPELTAARFYADDDGRRWWRSGDLVSQDAAGVYHHRGRMDDVVKVGGKLAAPGDVTAVLMAVPGIRAAVTVPVVTDGNTRLVAHVEIEPGADVTLTAVRDALSARLQRHAVPAAVMRHAHLPVNARGKVDRKALADGPYEPW